MIPYGKQDLSDEDIQAVTDVLQSDFLTQGPQVPLFEQSLQQLTGADYAVAVNSATSALHIACLALGLGPGKLAWTSPITFVATANSVVYTGADVDFVDIDPDTFNLDPEKLREKLEYHSTVGQPLPDVVIPVHMCGQSCDMKAIHELSIKYGFRILEDAAHAIGGHYSDNPVGSCQFSEITVFSFHSVKIVTTGEGGAALTNHSELAERMLLLRSHGVTRDPALMDKEPDGGWYYQQVDLGFNYRMTDMQAALGTSQLKRLPEFVARRQQLAARYNQLLKSLPLKTPTVRENVLSAWHLYVIRLDLKQLKDDKEKLFKQLRASGIGVNLHYIPVYQQPFYRKRLGEAFSLPEAEQYYRKAISIPLFGVMSDEEQDCVVESLGRVLA